MKKIMTISTINLKGGAAKTSTILNLGGILKETGRKPLLIDMDPQQSASHWAKQGGSKFPYPIIFLEKQKDAKRFKGKIDFLIEEHKADILLFDTPPQLENEALLSALLSDIVLVPISPSPLDIWAGEKAIEMIHEARKERKCRLPKVALVPSRLMPKTVLGKEIKTILKRFNEPIAPLISMRVAMVEASIAGVPVNMYAPNSPSHKEFQELAKFVLKDLRKF